MRKSSRTTPARLIEPLVRFIKVEVSSSAMLLGAAIVALLWANLPISASYFALVDQPIFGATMKLAINDGLMAVFFLLVGLEIKRELRIGELAGWKKAALPIAGALGGMIVPALIFVAFNMGTSGARGWGIPMATDIAIALGVLNLAGKAVPLSLKAFLMALAIADDLGAVAVIALFYGQGVNPTMLLAAGGVTLGLLGLRAFRVRNLSPYLLLGLALWWFVLHSGIHATVAGVLLALFIPVSEVDTETISPLVRLENLLHPLVVYLVIPLFVFANIGIPVSDSVSQGLSSHVGQGVALGLLVGKPVGIVLACWLTVKLGIASLPSRVKWSQLFGTGLLAGIGFTMSLFVTELAFTDFAVINAAKGAILVASLTSAFLGLAVLRWAAKPRSN
ncbi:MAG: Na+/H+ antiporter NhaA [Fimbriimonadaceae bacterium]